MPAIHAPLRAVKQSRSPERQALAEAIADYQRRQQNVDAVEAALAAAQDTLRKAKRAVEDATEAIETAKVENADALVDAALGGPAKVRRTVKQARADLTAAEDEVEAAEVAVRILTERLAKVKLGHTGYETRVRDVVRAAPETAALVARYKEQLHAMFATRQALAFLGTDAWTGMVPEDGRNVLSLSERDFPGLNGARPWQEAVKALEPDSDAELPRVSP